MTLWTRLVVLASRWRALASGRALDEDFDSELRAHLAMAIEDNLRRGLTPAEAERQARLRLGGVAQLEEANRDARGLPFVETTMQDIRYALRALRKNPGYAAVAIATLAIGIGAGTSIFSVVGAVLIRPLPYRQPQELVRVFETNPLKNWTRNIAAPANWADWRARNRSFTDVAAYEQFNSVGSGASDTFLTGFGEPQGLKALGVSGNLFTILGATPMLGRVFTEEEMYDGRSRVAILSHRLWQTAFGGDPGIIGRPITLSGRTYDVVGVMPPSFFFPGRDVQLWLPFGYTPELIAKSRRPHWLGVVARLKPGVTLEQSRQDMAGIATQLEKQYPDTNTQMGVLLEPLHDSFASEPRAALLMLAAAVGLLFLIVCANIANLQLGRAVSRSRELAIRRALGAGRLRLLRQLLTESLVLSAAGGALGLALAASARAALVQFAASALPLFADVRLDRTVVLFAIALSIAAPVLFGILPALASSKTDHVNDRSGTGARHTRWLRNGLVAGEVALSIVLVVGAVLLVRSLARLNDVNPGFDPDRAVAFTLTLPSARYPNAGARFLAFREIERRLREQPGVQSVGAISTLALRGFTWTGDATIEGRAPTDYERELRHASITPGYFAAMGTPLVAGRMITDEDTRERPPVTIVNEALARKYFHGTDAVGKRITFGRPMDNAPWITIVGVVADEKQDGMDKPAAPAAYQGIAQAIQNPLTFVVRTSVDADAAIATARAQVREVDKDLALTQVATLRDVVDSAMQSHRFRTALLTAFAGIALFLAALGIYGVLAYFVTQRTRELGIRLALGARRQELFALVVSQGLRPVALGAAAGIAGALAVTRLMSTLVYDIQPIDPISYAVALSLLAALALASCALPALRATRVDPLVALRDD